MYQAPDILLFSQIAVTPSVYLSSVAQQLINNKSLESLDVVQLIDLETKNEKWLSPLGFSVDYLLGHGMSINFLIFLLIIPLVTLFVVIGKQVI